MQDVLEVIETHEANVVDTIFVRDALVFAIIIIAIVIVLKQQNVFASKSERKIKKDRKAYIQEQKNREQQVKRLKAYRDFATKFGGPIPDATMYMWEFRIQRLFTPMASVGRTMTATELIGLMRMLQFVTCSISIAGLVLNGSMLYLLLLLCGFTGQLLFKMLCDMQIQAQDANIDRDFAEVYLLIHSKLVKGTDAHILPILVDYLNICDSSLAPEDFKDLRRFVQDLVTTINVVTDESTALLKIREKYKTATIVNFCNLAVQSLRGVDNLEKLMSFKLDLMQRTKAAAELNAKKRAEKAQMSIYAVWFILFQVVAVALVTRLLVVL